MKNNKSTLYRILRPVVTIFMKAFYKIEIIGKENILKKESLILAGNHTSKLDPLLLASCSKRTIHFLAKNELHQGFKRHFFRSAGTIPVDRKRKDEQAKIEAENCLKSGNIIGIFPEGTINKTKNVIMPFKFGAVSLSKKTNSKIVPFIITNEYKLFKKSVKIEFLKPYNLSSDDLEIENKKLMNIVEEKLLEHKRRQNEII